MNEILGSINGFVEHEGLKVILAANQKEVGKGAYIKNLELKPHYTENKGGVQAKKMLKWLWFICAGMRFS